MAPDADICDVVGMVNRANLNDGTEAAAGAIDALHTHCLAGGLFVPCEMGTGMYMGADAKAVLLTVAHALKAVGAMLWSAPSQA